MLLEGKKLLITGVLTPQSIAYAVAETAKREGAEIVLTGFGRAMSLTQRSAKRLGLSDVLELDVANPAHFQSVAQALKDKWGVLHGALHAVAYAPEDALYRMLKERLLKRADYEYKAQVRLYVRRSTIAGAW